MTTPQIADRLVALCRQGEFRVAQQELFADNVVSIEPYSMPGFDKETKNLKNVLEKGDLFKSLTEELHSVSVSDPLTTAKMIAFTMTMDVTMVGRGRSASSELCVYTVQDGKIVSEQFFM